MDGDSRDVDHLGDPLLCSIMSNLRSSPSVTGCVHTFVSSEGCHIIAEAYLIFSKSRCLMLDIMND